MKYLLPLLLFFSCTTTPVVEAPAVVTPVVEPVIVAPDGPTDYRADWPSKEWTRILAKALKETPELLAAEPKDLKDYCSSGDKVQCYVAILSSMARYESNFKPETKYKEGFNDVNGNPVYSRGLLQISIESANGNYGCGFKTAQEIHEPAKHLPCVVKMARKLIVQNGVISAIGPKGLGRYWSVLRYGHKNQKIDAIKKRSKELSAI